MKVSQSTWTPAAGWSEATGPQVNGDASLLLAFGAPELLHHSEMLNQLRQAHPQAHLLGCSTAGEIAGTHVLDDSLVLTAVAFDHTTLRTAQTLIDQPAHSADAGRALAGQLPLKDLVHVLVLSDGLLVNGSELVKGLASALPAHIAVTGGLSGDGTRFQKTLVFLDDAPSSGRVVAIGFYSTKLRVGYASMGGWDSFGPERLVTRSQGNMVFELDHQPALDLYKKYLGDFAKDLPASGLLFPLAVRAGNDTAVVRTILAVDEQAKSLTFAGDVAQGAFARLMKSNVERLVAGAHGAAKSTHAANADLAILISCVGRKLVLKQRTEEELETVQDVLGSNATLAGFYSYGEICPFNHNTPAQLHNQTMTITTFSEEH